MNYRYAVFNILRSTFDVRYSIFDIRYLVVDIRYHVIFDTWYYLFEVRYSIIDTRCSITGTLYVRSDIPYYFFDIWYSICDTRYPISLPDDDITPDQERGLALDPRPPVPIRLWHSSNGDVDILSPGRGQRGGVEEMVARGGTGWRVRLGRTVRLELERSLWFGDGPAQPGSLHLRWDVSLGGERGIRLRVVEKWGGVWGLEGWVSFVIYRLWESDLTILWYFGVCTLEHHPCCMYSSVFREKLLGK